MQSLGNIIGSHGKKSSLMRGVREIMAVEESNNVLIGIFGETAKHFCQVMSVKNGILVVACLDTALEEQIKLRKKEIMSDINKKLEDEAVANIRFLA